jgi:predicted metal-dependent phosphoesterase TrpH
MPSGVIDLHLHTTASDGSFEPAALVALAWGAGIRTMSVTDHDTVAGIQRAAAQAAEHGIAFVPGIEITAVLGERDIHILGYFIDPENAPLNTFLRHQRADRVRRVSAMADRLAALGKPIDGDALRSECEAAGGRAVGRPMVARALVQAGHVADMRQAFERWIGDGKAAYVARQGATPTQVIAMISEAGGLASLAHPGLLRRDTLIPELVDAGLAALEAYHSDHDAKTTEHYLGIARTHDLAVSGGSDYHGEEGHRKGALGNVGLPLEHFETLAARAKQRVG